MQYKKRDRPTVERTKEMALQSHAGFVQFVTGKVNKIGIETVLQQHQCGLNPPTEYYWLKKSYDRVLNFAEQLQLKQMPTKTEISGEVKLSEVIKLAYS